MTMHHCYLAPYRHEIDETAERSDTDDWKRYGVGPRWKDNSCRMDATFFCALGMYCYKAGFDLMLEIINT